MFEVIWSGNTVELKDDSNTLLLANTQMPEKPVLKILVKGDVADATNTNTQICVRK